MLYFHEYSSDNQKKEILNQYSFETDTLLVSDLRAKFEWQNKIMETSDVISEESVFRANEMWQKIASQYLPEFRIVSNSLLINFMDQYLSGKEEEWAKTPGASSSCLNYMNQLMSIVSHPNGKEQMKEWFLDNVESYQSWGHWYLLCDELWQVLKTEKIISANWLSGLIVNLSLDNQLWSRDLYIDLGLEIQFTEAEIFKELSNYLDVHILCPVAEWYYQYGACYQDYRPFQNSLRQGQAIYELFSDKENFLEQFNDLNKFKLPKEEKLDFIRYSSSLSEVKDVVQQIRKLLDIGVAIEEINIIAPDIGEYWLVLYNYLIVEGIPCQRPVNTVVQSFPEIYEWFANLKIAAKDWKSSDLELSLFQNNKSEMDFSQFKRIYRRIYSFKDLERRKDIYELYSKQFTEKDILNREEFITWSLKSWSNEEYFENLESILKTMVQECPLKIKMSLRNWIAYLNQIANSIEVSLMMGDKKGISCIDLSSAISLKKSYNFILGLSDSALRKASGAGISLNDALSIQFATGFPIAKVEDVNLEFYLKWFLEGEYSSTILSFPESNFEGSVQAPSSLWLIGRFNRYQEIENIKSPETNRWMELQQQNLSELSVVCKMATEQKEQISLEAEKLDVPSKIESKIKLLSASRIESFLKCPFVYASKYIFKLSSLPDLDLDIDPMNNGNMIHKIFELISHDLTKEWTDELLLKLIDDAKALQSQIELGQNESWNGLRFKYLKIAKKFIEFEKQWKEEFPSSQIYKREYEINAFVEPKTFHFYSDSSTNRIPFKGYIDRIDRNMEGDELALIDYKNTQGDHQNADKWIVNNDLQLLLYTMAIEEGVCPDLAPNVVSAVYYSIKPWKRSTGFVQKEANNSFQPSNDKKRNKLDTEAKKELIQLAKEKLIEMLQKIQEGKFDPKPNDIEKQCRTCDWKNICRAGHLA